MGMKLWNRDLTETCSIKRTVSPFEEKKMWKLKWKWKEAFPRMGEWIPYSHPILAVLCRMLRLITFQLKGSLWHGKLMCIPLTVSARSVWVSPTHFAMLNVYSYESQYTRIFFSVMTFSRLANYTLQRTARLGYTWKSLEMNRNMELVF